MFFYNPIHLKNKTLLQHLTTGMIQQVLCFIVKLVYKVPYKIFTHIVKQPMLMLEICESQIFP